MRASIAQLIARVSRALHAGDPSRVRDSVDAPSATGATGPVVRNDVATLQRLLLDYMTQREASEEALLEQQELYRVVTENVGALVCLVEPTGQIVYVSPSSVRVLGFEPQALASRSWREIVHPEDVPDWALDQMLAGHAQPSLTFRAQHHDGHWIWLSASARPVRSRIGSAALLCVTAHDVTRRHEAEAMLAASETRYKSLILRAAFGIYRTSPDGRFLDVNPALVQMLGYDSAGELLGLNIAAHVYLDPEKRTELATRAQHGTLADWVHVRWKRRDGTPITARLSLRPVFDSGEGLVAFEGIVEDVTDRLHQEELFRRSERMASLGHTVAGVAHELNNPLAAVSGFAQLLLREPRAADERAALETIEEEARRAARVVKDLLAFSRRQGSRSRSAVDVNEIVRYIVGTQRFALEARGIQCRVELADGLSAALADAAQLEQVVLNLVVNAREALRDTAPVMAQLGVTTRMAPNGHIALEVTDTGAGIAPAVLPRIWDPFWTTKDEGEGTGLGLSVVHGIVAAHGGTIDVSSTLGTGTHFTVLLPPAPASIATTEDAFLRVQRAITPVGSARPVDSPTPGMHRAFRPLDVLVVDDDPDQLAAVARHLGTRGHRVVTVRGATDAVRVVSERSADVVLCGVCAGAGSDDTVRQLRRLAGGAGARYVVARLPGGRATPAGGAQGGSTITYVPHPYDMTTLHRAIEEDG